MVSECILIIKAFFFIENALALFLSKPLIAQGIFDNLLEVSLCLSNLTLIVEGGEGRQGKDWLMPLKN